MRVTMILPALTEATSPLFRPIKYSRVHERLRHLAYAGGWKKFEWAWDMLIRTHRVVRALPMLEHTLAAFGGNRPGKAG
ncbi:MAG TPA: hypothetical protein VFZ85_08150 [Jiangellaceae bacterium]